MNLSELHRLVAEVCPIRSLYKSGGTIAAVYEDSATQEQRSAAATVIATAPLLEARQAAAERIAAGYANAVAGGFTPAGEEWSISADAQADITGLGLRVLIEQMQSTDTLKLPTSAGAITMTVANAQPIMVAYGQWLTPKREQLVQKTADAAIASSVESANAIVWS